MLIDREKFRRACARLDRTQAWVARKAGVSKQGLQHYLNGRSMPAQLYPRIAALLGTHDFLADDLEARAA